MVTDNSPESQQISQLQMMADNSPQAANTARLQAMADGSPSSVAQMMGLEGMFGAPVQMLEENPQGEPVAQQPGGLEGEEAASEVEESPEPAPEAASEPEGQAPAAGNANFSMLLGLAETAAVPEQATEQTPAQAPAEAAASGDSGGGSEAEGPAPAEGDSAFSMLAEKAEAAGDPETVLADTSGGGEAAGESSPASAEGDPVFMALLARVEAIGAQERAHVPAEEASSAAQAAAVGPSNEVASMAEAGQVSAMDQQQPQPFDRAGFKKALMDKIAATAPKTLEQADQFKSGNKLASITNAVTGKVKESKEKAQGPIEKTAKATPDTAGVTPKPVTDLAPQDAGAAPADPGFADATPGPKSEGEVSGSFQAGSQSLDQQMAEAQITEEQLANSNEPAFLAALNTKKDAQASAAQAPGLYRQQEQSMLASAKADATATAQAQTAAMHGDRAGLLDQVTSSQTQSKTKDEQQRAKVASDIQAIYGKTKSDVEKRLSKLDTDVKNVFTKGAKDAKKAFEGYVDGRMATFKKARYSGFWGPAKWLKDKVWGMPSEVNSFYSQGRADYISQMVRVIDNVVTIVETGLTEAKSIIAQGKQQIQTYVTGLPQSLQSVGADAASDIQSKFAELESSVDAKQGELINTLAQKYNDSLKQIDADIDARKSANEGLVDKAINAVAGAIATLIQLKNMLMSTLGKAVAVVGIIIADPIGFLGRLVKGVQLGLNNFLAKIGMYLQQGLMEWLTGAVAATGIKLPDKFDLPGIFSLVIQVLGLTYSDIRATAVKVLGERVVKALETTFEIFKIMVTEGVAGLWKYIQGKIGDLKAMVMDKIEDLLITQVIDAGIKWIIGLLSPVGALIKAAKAIYDIITWITTKGKALIEFVNSVLDSVMAIAKGNLSGAAKLVESSLAKAVPILISFLASLLGLNTIPDKVKAILETVRAPIRKAIAWVLEKAKAFAMKMGGKLGVGTGAKGAKVEDGDPKKLTIIRREDLENEIEEALKSASIKEKEELQEQQSIIKAPQLLKDQINITERKRLKRGGEIKRPERSKRRKDPLVEDYIKTLKHVSIRLTQIHEKYRKRMHASKLVRGKLGDKKYVLKPEWTAKQIRKRLYPNNWLGNVESEIKGKVETLKLEDDQSLWRCPGTPFAKAEERTAEHEVSVTDYQIDHISPVAEHWMKKKGGGNNMDQNDRSEFYRGIKNLQPLCTACNKNKSNKIEEKAASSYRPFVGEDFLGPNEKKRDRRADKRKA